MSPILHLPALLSTPSPATAFYLEAKECCWKDSGNYLVSKQGYCTLHRTLCSQVLTTHGQGLQNLSQQSAITVFNHTYILKKFCVSVCTDTFTHSSINRHPATDEPKRKIWSWLYSNNGYLGTTHHKNLVCYGNSYTDESSHRHYSETLFALLVSSIYG